jgi:hypothetical protein
MAEETEKAGKIQGVERDLRPKRRKIEQPLLGKINTLTEKKNFSVVKNDTHKIRGLHRVKIKT